VVLCQVKSVVSRERRTRERREAEELGTCGYRKAMDWMKEAMAAEVQPANRAKRVGDQSDILSSFAVGK